MANRRKFGRVGKYKKSKQLGLFTKIKALIEKPVRKDSTDNCFSILHRLFVRRDITQTSNQFLPRLIYLLAYRENFQTAPVKNRLVYRNIEALLSCLICSFILFFYYGRNSSSLIGNGLDEITSIIFLFCFIFSLVN